MAATMYKMKAGGASTSAGETALAGSETVGASVEAGEVAVIIDSGARLNSIEVENAINVLRDAQKEFNKDAQGTI